jgi:hypothetical protein
MRDLCKNNISYRLLYTRDKTLFLRKAELLIFSFSLSSLPKDIISIYINKPAIFELGISKENLDWINMNYTLLEGQKIVLTNSSSSLFCLDLFRKDLKSIYNNEHAIFELGINNI